MTRERAIIYGARLLSLVFTPFYLPLMGIIAVFTFSYLSMLPQLYRLKVLVMIYLFTVLLPSYLIHFYRKHRGWTLVQLGKKERRVVPYVLSILCYLACIWIMNTHHYYTFIASILMAALTVQMVCAMINVWWKISTHTAAIGGVTGAVVTFAELFGFNPVGWICALIILAGMVGSARMILRQHTLAQVVAGWAVGVVSAVAGIVLF